MIDKKTATCTLGSAILTILSIQAANLYVDKDNPAAGNTSAHGSENAPFLSIPYALGRLASGDTLFIKQSISPYSISGGLLITGPDGSAGAPTCVKAFPGHTPSLVGGGNDGRIALDNVAYWRIEGLEVSRLNHIIMVRNGSHHVVIVNNFLHDSGGEILRIMGNCFEILIENNRLENGGSIGPFNGEGIYIGGSDSGGDDTHHVTVRGNRITNTEHESIELKADSHDCLIENNVCRSMGFNFEFGKWGIEASAPVTYQSNPNHIIRNNVISDHKGAGSGAPLGIKTGAQVYNNVVYQVGGTGFAVEIQGGDSYTRYIWNNTFNITPGKAILNGGGTSSIGNNIGPPTSGSNRAYDANFFINAAANDYHLRSALPGVNPPISILRDIEGATRGNPPDIGAYEFIGSTPTPSPSPSASPTPTPTPTATPSPTPEPDATPFPPENLRTKH